MKNYIKFKVFFLMIFTLKTSNGSTLNTLVKDDCYYYIESEPIPYGLGDIKQLESFIKYIKTQSNRLETEVGEQDIYFVIQVMLNRLRVYNCPDWNYYYQHQSVNNSESIRRLKIGVLSPSFSLDDKRDGKLISMLYLVLYGAQKVQFKIDENCLYFESCKTIPNSGPHRRDKLITKARHRFYCK